MFLYRLSIFLTGVDLKKGSNGIGPNSWGYWRILIPFQKRFANAAITHDISYCLGLDEEDKEEADNKFLYDMAEMSGYNIIAMLFSILYYLMVYYFGYKYFNFNIKTNNGGINN